jgi:hypothetical protein
MQKIFFIVSIMSILAISCATDPQQEISRDHVRSLVGGASSPSGSTGGLTGSTGSQTGSTGGLTGSTGSLTGSTGSPTGSTGGLTGSTGSQTANPPRQNTNTVPEIGVLNLPLNTDEAFRVVSKKLKTGLVLYWARY